ncbi:MAG: hypothetical protein QM599_06925 [Pseudoxanthomonas sp.]
MGTYVYGSSREEVLANAHRNWQGQYQPGSVDRRVWQKLGPELIVDLLAGAGFHARHDARKLVAGMQQSPWRILATVHEGGTGDAQRGSDAAPHVTLQVGGRKYHLRCKESPSLHVVEITA